GGADAVQVGVAGGDGGVFVGGGRAVGGRDLREVGAAGALAAFDLVAGDADVVGRGRPGQVDLGARDGVRGQRRRRRRRRRVRTGLVDRRRLIRLDLRGG